MEPPSVKVLVVGDPGVGKTSFVHLASYQQALQNPPWTVGCSVEVKVGEQRWRLFSYSHLAPSSRKLAWYALGVSR